jgi:hypothetical protein
MLPLEIATESAQILCDETLSVRRLPANFDEQDKTLFEHELNKLIPVTQLLELNHVNVSSDGIVFSPVAFWQSPSVIGINSFVGRIPEIS